MSVLSGSVEDPVNRAGQGSGMLEMRTLSSFSEGMSGQ